MLRKYLVGLLFGVSLALFMWGFLKSQVEVSGEASLLGLVKRLHDASAANAVLCIAGEDGCQTIEDCSQLRILLPPRSISGSYRVEEKPIAPWEAATCTLTHTGIDMSVKVRITGTRAH
ncbi:MAG: hypothetical protein H7833_18315 [Magnetococcus sp. DMHC-1]